MERERDRYLGRHRGMPAIAARLWFAAAARDGGRRMRGRRARIAALARRLGDGGMTVAAVADARARWAAGPGPAAALPYALLCLAALGAVLVPGAVPTVAVAACVGGYLATQRMLLRAVQNGELSTLMWLRCAAHLVQGMATAWIAARVLADAGLTRATTDAAATALGFAAGYAPDPGLARVARRLRLRLAKPVDDAGLNAGRVLPLEMLDGIDGDIAQRLAQGGWYDVQNLATANPVTIHVATPYGLMQAIDWVGQAQLCLGVGCDAWLALRARHVRTLSDLECVAAVPALAADLAPLLGAGGGDGGGGGGGGTFGPLVAMLGAAPHVVRVRALARALAA